MLGKRIISGLLALVLLLGNVPVAALAQEVPVVLPEVEETEVIPAVSREMAPVQITGNVSGLPDDEALLEGYLYGLFYGNNGTDAIGVLAENALPAKSRSLYNYLKDQILQVAAGECSSAVFRVTDTQIAAWGSTGVYAEADLNLFWQEFQVDMVIDALLHDCPYELYWYDKVNGMSVGGSYYMVDGGYQIAELEFAFQVVADLQGSGYTEDAPVVDTTMVDRAAAAASNARLVVTEHAAKSDYEKLTAYKEEICALVTYDDAAAEAGTFSSDADPWQLINVFDGDPATNVVCEGYSKAYQYLCDMSQFQGTVNCYSVVGQLDGGNHMWNHVTIGGKTYLADITNSDEGTAGSDGSLFLVGGAGSITGGYSFAGCSFTFDADTQALWGTGENSILKLATENYDPTPEDTNPDTGVAIDETNFPDEIFRAYVSEYFDTDGDGVLSEEEIAAVNSIYIPNMGIQDLTGIEFFLNMTALYCNNNQLRELSLSNNPMLQTLFCSNNQLLNLNLSNNAALTVLYCNDNQLTTLDTRNNAALTELRCYNNRLTILDVKLNTDLRYLECQRNHLTSVDLSNNDALVNWDFYDNSFNICLDDGVTFDLGYLPSVFDVSKTSNWDGGRVNDNILTVDDTLIIRYTYDCGNGIIESFALHITDSNTNIPESTVPEETEEPGAPHYEHDFSKKITSIDYLEAAATCTEAASYYYCCSCGAASTDTYVHGSPLGHHWIEATECTVLRVCTRCPAWEPRGQEHTWRVIDCTLPRECENCGTTEDLPAGHDIVTYSSKNPTCTEAGWESYEACTRCDYTTYQALTALGHDIVFHKTKIPTCTDPGWGAYETCSRCDYTTYVEEAALGHSFVKEVADGTYLKSAATCIESAIFYLSCECGEKGTDTFSYGKPNGHTGGTATETQQAICEVCQTPYGDLLPPAETEPETEPTEPVTEPSEPEETEPATEPTEPKETEPVTEATEPEETEPVTEPSEPENIVPIDESNFPDEIFRDYVRENVDTNGDVALSESEIADVTTINVSSLGIQSLSGIGYFANLDCLICSDNQLSELDVSSNSALTVLRCNGNQLTELDVKNNTALTDLSCQTNQLTELDIRSNTALSALGCGGNQLKTLDVSNNIALTELWCESNYLTQLDVSNNTELKYLLCNNNQLTTLNAGRALIALDCFSNQLMVLDLSGCTELAYLNCNNNQLSSLNVSSCRELYCYNNQLTELDLSSCVNLDGLFCSNNQLVSLDVSNHTWMTYLECANNQLVELDVSGCTNLGGLYCANNQLTSLDVADCLRLFELKCHNNQRTVWLANNGTFNLLSLPGAFDVSNASNWVGGSVKGSILTVAEGVEIVTYTYDCGNDFSESFTLRIMNNDTELPDTTEPEEIEPSTESTEPEPEVPDAPAVKASNLLATGQIKLTWNAVEHASHYKILRGEILEGSYFPVSIQMGTEYTDPDAQPGRMYYYHVIAVSEENVESTPGTVSRTCDLPCPTGIKVTNDAATGKNKISWNAVSGAAQYQVWYSETGKTGSFKVLMTTKNLSHIHKGAEAGKLYYYKVKALHTNTNAHSALTGWFQRTCDLGRPNVTASNVASTGKIKLSWPAVPGAVKYEIWRSASGKAGTFGRISTVKATSFVATGTGAGKTYYYKVKAIHSNANVNSAFSLPDLRTCDLPRPVVTAGNNATTGKVRLTWKSVTGASKYQVWYSATGKANTFKCVWTTKNLYFNHNASKVGVKGYYKVKAIHTNTAANSAYSTVVSRAAK